MEKGIKCQECNKELSPTEAFFWDKKVLCWTCINALIKKQEQEILDGDWDYAVPT